MNFIKKYKKLIIIVSIAVIILFIWAFGKAVEEGTNEKNHPEYSTYSRKDDGYYILYKLASKIGYDIERFERPARLLPNNKILLVYRPSINIINAQEEIKYLNSWIEKGNIMILVEDYANVSKINIKGLSLHNNNVAEDDVLEITLGKGKIYVFQDVSGLTNKGLQKLEPGVEFIRLLDSLNNNQLLFNEYYQGIMKPLNLYDLLGVSGNLILVQFVLFAVVLILSISRRKSSPIKVSRIEKRLENEKLFALANIYDKTKSYDLVLSAQYDIFKQELAKYLGLSKKAEREEIAAESKKDKILKYKDLGLLFDEIDNVIKGNVINNKKLVDLAGKMEEIRREIKR